VVPARRAARVPRSGLLFRVWPRADESGAESRR
jgi:hypothetical protein